MSKMNKVSGFARIVVECMWFAAAVACVFIAVREFMNHNTKQAITFFALALLAVFYFIYRRNVRMKMKE